MNTVVVVLAVILTASWWFRRAVPKNHATISSASHPAVSALDRPGAAPSVTLIRRTPLVLAQRSSDDNRPPPPHLEHWAATGGKGPQSPTNEILTPIRRRFLELKGEVAAIVERHREQQAQPHDQLARELAVLRKQLERLQQEAYIELEYIDPKLYQDFIRRSRRDNGG
ncbi:MAG: hypothetical protein R6X18_17495 [Chloroflexota bacterium]